MNDTLHARLTAVMSNAVFYMMECTMLQHHIHIHSSSLLGSMSIGLCFELP